MKLAIEQAKIAQEKDEVPVGAIVVNKNNVIASSYNMTITSDDPTAHAEILVIRKACESLATSILCDADIYVTLEPCPMCAQAISFAKIRRLYFGAYNPKGGGVENGAKIFRLCNHIPEIYGGILEIECSLMLKDFFEELRST
ncbi:MAG: nucleoside deaminase [Wolbachia sp.]|nr:nucleoside deaminase [Wolbachia sp.]